MPTRGRRTLRAKPENSETKVLGKLARGAEVGGTRGHGQWLKRGDYGEEKLHSRIGKKIRTTTTRTVEKKVLHSLRMEIRRNESIISGGGEGEEMSRAAMSQWTYDDAKTGGCGMGLSED